MDYAEAADYAESLLFAKNAIGKAVVSARMQQRAERLEFDMRTGGDSTARLAIQAVTPLAAVRCIYLGQAFLVYQPEKWLDVIERSLLLFRQRFGDKSYKAIQHRYVYHWTVRKISVIDEISPQVYALRRRSFMDGLLMLAIQEGLIRIDINANSFQKARAEQKKEGKKAKSRRCRFQTLRKCLLLVGRYAIIALSISVSAFQVLRLSVQL